MERITLNSRNVRYLRWTFLRSMAKERRRRAHRMNFPHRRRIRWPKEEWVSEDLAAAVADLEKSHASGHISSSRYGALIRWCTEEQAFSYGVRVHKHMDETRYMLDTFMGNLLIKFYGKCGNLLWARDVLQEMPQVNVFTWNTLLALHSMHQDHRQVYKFFLMMQRRSLPDATSYRYVIKACAHLRRLDMGISFHNELIDRQVVQDHQLQSALISMYSMCSRLDIAMQVFQDIMFKEPLAWNAIILALGKSEEYRRALELYWEMLLEGKEPNKMTYSKVLACCIGTGELGQARSIAQRVNATGMDQMRSRTLQSALARVYAHLGMFQEARQALDRLPSKMFKSPWTACLRIYAQQGFSAEAIDLYRALVARGILLNPEASALAVDACCAPLCDLKQGRAIHAKAIAQATLNSRMVTSLIRLYSDCGRIEEARILFDRKRRKGLGSYRQMITSYAQQGRFSECLEIHEEMQAARIKGDDAIHVAMFAACSKPENLSKGEALLSGLSNKESLLSRNVQNAALSMFAACGEVEKASKIFQQMGVQQDGSSWNGLGLALANAGRLHELPALIQTMQLEGFEPAEQLETRLCS